MDVSFRLNVTAANFPLISNAHGRSILAREAYDSNYVVVNAYGGASADRDVGVPTFMYLQNVMPTITGFKSVGYRTVSNKAGVGRVKVLRTCEEERYMFLPTAATNYIFQQDRWESIWGFSSSKNATYAHIHKDSYVCHEYSGIQRFTGDSLVDAQIKGLDTSKILGITHANNYLVAYTEDTIHWSNVLDSTDFVPALSTRAGSIIPLHVRGAIVFCYPTSNGFVIFTTVNMVRASHTGDKDLPFKFEEIANSGGIKSQDHVTQDNNHDNFYCWTNKGLQQVDKLAGKAENIFPEITDFLTCKYFEEYIGDHGVRNSTNESEVWASQSESWDREGFSELKVLKYDGNLNIKLAIIANRFLCISYSLPDSTFFTYCLVYDSQLKRWGKLKIEHSDCFEIDSATHKNYLYDNKDVIGFLSPNGAIRVLDYDEEEDSVVFFGKLQHLRARVCTLHSIEIENAYGAELKVFTSLDGKNINPAIYPMRQMKSKDFGKWIMRTTGVNHTLCIYGKFDVVSLQGTITLGGSR